MRKTVDSVDFYVVASEVSSGLCCADTHVVGMGVYHVCLWVNPEQGVGDGGCPAVVPVGMDACKDVEVGKGVRLCSESGMAQTRRGCVTRPLELNDVELSRIRGTAVEGDCLAELSVVYLHVGGKSVAIYLAVEGYYRNILVDSFFHNRSDCRRFIWRDDDKIASLVDEMAYVIDLAAVVAVGGAEKQFHVVMKQCLALYLVVGADSPIVVRTLGNADSEFVIAGGFAA